jgi:hypothetical protein
LYTLVLAVEKRVGRYSIVYLLVWAHMKLSSCCLLRPGKDLIFSKNPTSDCSVPCQVQFCLEVNQTYHIMYQIYLDIDLRLMKLHSGSVSIPELAAPGFPEALAGLALACAAVHVAVDLHRKYRPDR